MSEQLVDAIRDSAQGPKRVQGDSGGVEWHDLNDQVAANVNRIIRRRQCRHCGRRMTTTERQTG